MGGPVPLWDTDDNGVPLWQRLDELGPDATEEERRAVMTEVVTGRKPPTSEGKALRREFGDEEA